MKGELEQEMLAGVLPVLRAEASDGMVFLAYVSRQWDGYDRARFATAQAAVSRSRALYEVALLESDVDAEWGEYPPVPEGVGGLDAWLS
jgi:hypothetical protein